jgi:cytochrome bd ubiquinol oxidase subunit II
MLAELVALTLLVALVAYALTGGADFGGGVWDLFASGPRKAEQRALIERALAPIWEANHVWLILIVVVLFVALPHAYAVISTALHIPLVLLLIGIVLRGAAFVFRSYDPTPGVGAARWRLVFAIASLVTPIFLGVVLGALLTGELRVDAEMRSTVGFVAAWLDPFPFLVGLFIVTLFAFLAAVYLAVEATGEPALQRDFRARALISGVAAGALSIAVLWLSRHQAPALHAGIQRELAGLLLQLAVALLALGALLMLLRERYRVARRFAVAQVTLIVVGLGLAQWPYVIAPDMTFEAALAPAGIVVPMLVALAVATPLLLVALVYLYRVFKSRSS